MFSVVLTLHSLMRWVVILLGVVATGRGKLGWFLKRRWTPADDRVGRLFVAAFDVQVLLGLMLYLVLSPITTGAFRNMGAAMQNSVVRFWVAEHITAMILGLALAHIGRVRLGRATDDRGRHRTAVWFFGFALLLVLLGTPWPFSPAPRPLWPF
jgi:hypothetical protein